MQNAQERFQRVQKIGVETGFADDLYHWFLRMNWITFLVGFVVGFLILNLCFGMIYWLVPGSVQGAGNSLFDHFVFSVQTFSTVGFGVLSPASTFANCMVIVESIVSILYSAILTGLLFSKFSSPTARVIFTEKIIISPFDGVPTMMFRMGNLRGNQILEARVSATMLRTQITSEGFTIRRQIDLKLVRSSSLFFVLTWTVMHIIDETSPLFGLSQEDIVNQNIEIGVAMVGFEETFSQNIHATGLYTKNDIIFAKGFADVLVSEQGIVRKVDYSKFNDLRT